MLNYLSPMSDEGIAEETCYLPAYSATHFPTRSWILGLSTLWTEALSCCSLASVAQSLLGKFSEAQLWLQKVITSQVMNSASLEASCMHLHDKKKTQVRCLLSSQRISDKAKNRGIFFQNFNPSPEFSLLMAVEVDKIHGQKTWKGFGTVFNIQSFSLQYKRKKSTMSV